MKKVCIFDFDGTLMNTITDVAICFNESLAYFGFETYPIEMYKNFVGGNLETVIGKLLKRDKIVQNDEDIKKIKDYYLSAYSNSKKENTVPYENIINVLKLLQEKNVKLAINTNKKQILTEELCEKFFKEIDFCKIIGYREDYPSKPDPTAVYDILKYTNLKKEDAIYIGDGLSDVKTAENAKIDMIFANWGQGKEEDKASNVVKFIAKEPMDIYKILVK